MDLTSDDNYETMEMLITIMEQHFQNEEGWNTLSRGAVE